MTTFHAPHNHRTLTIGQHADGSGITFHAEDGSASVGVYLDPADAPAIALAVTDSGGIEPTFHAETDMNDPVQLAEMGAWYLHKSVKVAERMAAAASEEAARGKRRDELAQEIYNWAYHQLTSPGKRAIDRIIDTELELAKERTK